MNIEELKEKVEQTQKANAIRVRDAAEVARLEATLRQEDSDSLFNARVAIQLSSQQTEKLQRLVDECAELIASMPIQNAKTRAARVWSESHRYNFGTQIDLMYQLASGILYSCAEHKAILLEHTGLNLELIEELVNAFGAPSYYSRNYNTIVDAKPYNVERLQTVLQVMQSTLGVVINSDAVTADNMKLDFVRGETRAQQDFDQAAEAISEADFQI